MASKEIKSKKNMPITMKWAVLAAGMTARQMVSRCCVGSRNDGASDGFPRLCAQRTRVEKVKPVRKRQTMVTMAVR